MTGFRQGAVLCTLLWLTACGFQPLYGDHALSTTAAVRESFNNIAIANIPDQSGQYLKNALMDRLYSVGRPDAGARYRLTVSSVNESRRELDITKTSDSTRAQLSLSTVMVLSDAEGSKLLSRSLGATTSYNILDSQFTTRVAEDSARRQALDDLARQVESHLLLYFNR